jgi:hypothetical protein
MRTIQDAVHNGVTAVLEKYVWLPRPAQSAYTVAGKSVHQDRRRLCIDGQLLGDLMETSTDSS